MSKVPMNAERLAKAMCAVRNTSPMGFERGFVYWTHFLEEAKATIRMMNLMKSYEQFRGFHLQGDTEDAECVKDTYERFYTGPSSHLDAFCVATGADREDFDLEENEQ